MNAQTGIINLSYYKYNETNSIERHSHDGYYQIFYIVRGRAEYRIGGIRRQLKNGEFAIVPPKTDHEMYPGICEDYCVLDLKFTVRDAWMQEKIAKLRYYVEYQKTLCDIFALLTDEVRNHSRFYGKISSSYLDALLLNLARNSEQGESGGLENRILADMSKVGTCTGKVLIELEGLSSGEHYQGSIEAIARKIGYNKEYMCRHFSEEIGIGITEYLMLLRIEKAKELLISTDYQICQIAEMVGYSSESYFIRLFRKIIGVSPLRYRNFNAQNEGK